MKNAKIGQTPRVGIFLEENLLISARKSGQYLDFNAVMGVAQSLGSVVHASVHLSHASNAGVDEGTRRVSGALGHAGFEVVLQPRARSAAGQEKSRVDVDLAFMIARVAIQESLDVCIVGTGDSDFVNILGELETLGTTTMLLCPGKGQTSPELLLSASAFLSIDELGQSASRAFAS